MLCLIFSAVRQRVESERCDFNGGIRANPSLKGCDKVEMGTRVKGFDQAQSQAQAGE